MQKSKFSVLLDIVND